MYFKNELQQIVGWLTFKSVFAQHGELTELKAITNLPRASLVKKLKQLERLKIVTKAKQNWQINLKKLPQDSQKKFTNLNSNLALEFSLENHHEQTELINRYLAILAKLPGLVAVAVCNSYALKTTTKDSDIDLFLVCTPQTLFINRIIITLYFQLLGRRRHHNKVINRFCLSFWISSEQLNLEECLRGVDPYFYYWFHSLNWVIAPQKRKLWTGKLFKKNKGWLHPFFINRKGFCFFTNNKIKFYPSSHNSRTTLIQKILNPSMKRWQLSRAQQKWLKNNQSRGVIINDNILKFHKLDQRPQINEAFHYLFKQILHYNPELK